MTHRLKDLLEASAEHVSGPDLAAGAWGAAQTVRRRRRLLGAAATAVAAAVVVAAMVLPDDRGGSDTLPASTPTSTRPTPSATGPQPWRSAQPVDVMGVNTTFGPTVEQVASLPRVDDRTAKVVGLPQSLNPSAREVRPLTLEQPALAASGDAGAPVTAVLLRHGSDGALFPLLHRPALSRPWQEVDALALRPVTDSGGNESDPIGDRAVSPDGRRVAFPQPGKVVVLDVVTAQVRTVPVDDPYLEDVGWLGDGSALVARSSGRQWRVDPATGGVTAYGDHAYAGRYEISVLGDDVTLGTQGDQGLTTQQRKLPGVLFEAGDTVSGRADRAAVGAFLSPAAQESSPTHEGYAPYQGILTVDARTPSQVALLLVPDSMDGGFSKGCCRPLRWLGDDRLLVQWSADLLVWDLAGQEFARVSVAPRTEGSTSETLPPGTLSSSYAVAP
ncbi:hypothetical protein GCM10022415_30580 [Knoellia locipacati]|uniref:Uncharacterized protein n=1 Tax=Knoellia locipacati TaxID=882824 RepID=A0A512T3Y9_9MICO|nr:hypothetical protein [Knoellia locipacati]GEQ14938.1 hypothetical protein KLO01_29850 [Knoellia locipacati]